MERLTQWTKNGASLILGEPKTPHEAAEKLQEQFKKACNRLAELEDKLESGELLELPCLRKVKDYVDGSLYEFVFLNEYNQVCVSSYYDDELQEAEARLKELQEQKK